MEKRMKFDMAYNFDLELLEELKKIGNVHSVFAKINRDIIGGGRPSAALPNIEQEELKHHVRKAHEAGIKFNYLLNSVCMDNNELKKDFFFAVNNYLKQLIDLGVDSVTVANPFLCDMIKRNYPNLEICLSVNTRVHTIQQIHYWEQFGVNEITLDQIVNRNFDELEKILKYTKKTGTRIRLFANNICLHDCPLRTYHGLSNSHASQDSCGLKEHLHYYYYKCSKMKMEHLEKLISATWIRPDDLHYYREVMQKADNYNLVFKLAERSSTSAYLIKILRAYNEEHYEGNLMDIIYAVQGKNLLPIEQTQVSQYYKPEIMNKIKSLYNLDWLYIDNRALDGFLEGFREHYNCDHKICSDGKSRERNTCTYCKAWADKCIKYDKEKKMQYEHNLDDILEAIQKGDVFN